MKLVVLVATVAFSVVASLGGTVAAMAQSDCKTLVKASPFGPDDETGATNRVTPAVTKAAAAEIQTGKVTPMAFNLVDGVPLFGTRFTKTILTSASLVPGAEYGKNKLSYMEDTYLSQSHVGTHLDGLGHIGIKDCYYNQTPMGKYVTQNYMKKLGIEHINTFATRGVIIDLVKVFQDAGKLKSNAACTSPCLDGGTVITEADLQAGLKLYNVTLREGDAVFLNTGQVCLCAERIYAERTIFERFVEALKLKAESLRAGWPMEQDTNLGPLISEQHRDKVMGYYRLAQAEGATVITGGGIPEFGDARDKGFYIQPTIYTGLAESARCVKEEIFGPVCHVAPFDSEDEAVVMANDTKYGLAASVWTSNLKRGHTIAQQMNVGITWVNCWFLRDLRTPFGGVGLSGIGREGGVHSLNFYSELNNICVQL